MPPSSGLRLDALPPGGGPAGCDPAFARDQWLDPYGIERSQGKMRRIIDERPR